MFQTDKFFPSIDGKGRLASLVCSRDELDAGGGYDDDKSACLLQPKNNGSQR